MVRGGWLGLKKLLYLEVPGTYNQPTSQSATSKQKTAGQQSVGRKDERRREKITIAILDEPPTSTTIIIIVIHTECIHSWSWCDIFGNCEVGARLLFRKR